MDAAGRLKLPDPDVSYAPTSQAKRSELVSDEVPNGRPGPTPPAQPLGLHAHPVVHGGHNSRPGSVPPAPQ